MGDMNKTTMAAKTSVREEEEQTEWKVKTSKKEGVHFHPLKLMKATEKEMGKIKFTKYLSYWFFGKGKLQRHKFLWAETLNWERINVHIPGNAAKLKGVIYDVTLKKDNGWDNLKRRNVLKATRLQMQRNGGKSDSLSEFEKTMPKKITMGYDELYPSPNVMFQLPKNGTHCRTMQRKAKMC